MASIRTPTLHGRKEESIVGEETNKTRPLLPEKKTRVSLDVPNLFRRITCEELYNKLNVTPVSCHVCA